MIELTIINLVLLTLLAWEKNNNRKENAKFINALIAKDAREARDLDLADKAPTTVKAPEPDPFVNMDDLNDEQHEEAVKNTFYGKA